MSEWSRLFFGMIVDLFRSRAALEAEIVVLRQQLNVLRRACPKKLPFNSIDRLILGGACRLFPIVNKCIGNCPARHCDPLASCRISIVLALEIEASPRSTNRALGNSSADPRDEHRQPVVGSAKDPW